MSKQKEFNWTIPLMVVGWMAVGSAMILALHVLLIKGDLVTGTVYVISNMVIGTILVLMARMDADADKRIRELNKNQG